MNKSSILCEQWEKFLREGISASASASARCRRAEMLPLGRGVRFGMRFPFSAGSHFMLSSFARGSAPPCIPRSRSARPLHQSPSDFGPPFSLRKTPPPKSFGLWPPVLASQDPSTKVLRTLVPLPFQGRLRREAFPEPPLKGEGEGDRRRRVAGGCREGTQGPPCKRKNHKMAPRGQSQRNTARVLRGMRAASLRAHSAQRGGGGYTQKEGTLSGAFTSIWI